jgi:uncharacterized surface protein with fasciclin (FAS1) repeats
MDLWVQQHGCLSADDCSAQVAWNAQNVPQGNLCGLSGVVTFTASDVFGNVATKDLPYSFPIPPEVPCYICGHSAFGQRQKASIQMLTFRYDSPNQLPVSIRVYDDKGKSRIEPGSYASISPGSDVVAYVGFAARQRSDGSSSTKFPTNTVVEVTGIGSVTIHTSCSVALYTGQRFNLNNGASIVITDFRTDLSSGDQCPGANRPCAYPMVCNVPPPPFPAPPPTVPPTQPPCQTVIRDVCPSSKRNLRELVFKYVGTSALTNTQSGKASVSGTTGGAQVSISCENGGSQAVSLDGAYMLASNDGFDAETSCTILGSGGTQFLEIHTSCSKTLQTGDQFGNLLLVGFRWADGTYVNNDNCQAATGPADPHQNWQNGGTDGNYVPPTMASPTFPPVDPPTHYSTPSLPIAQLLASRSEYSTFYGLLVAANILNALSSSGPFTVLAPTNAAFADLGAATLASLQNDMGRLASVLLFHVIGGSARSNSLTNGQMLTTFNGVVTVTVDANSISFSSQASIVAASVVAADMRATNGVVHGVDAVLTPFLQQSPTLPPSFPYQPPSNPPTFPPVSYGGGHQAGYCESTQCCNVNTRITSLTFKYVGYNRISHQQSAWGKGYVNDMSPEMQQSVKLRLLSYKRASYDPTPQGWDFRIGLNEEFTITGNPNKRGKLGNALVLKIGNAKMKIATNCAAHIGVGDQFGVLVVTGWQNLKGQQCYQDPYASGNEQQIGASSSTSSSQSEGLSNVAVASIIVGTLAGAILVVAAVVMKRKASDQGWTTQGTHQ